MDAGSDSRQSKKNGRQQIGDGHVSDEDVGALSRLIELVQHMQDQIVSRNAEQHEW